MAKTKSELSQLNDLAIEVAQVNQKMELKQKQLSTLRSLVNSQEKKLETQSSLIAHYERRLVEQKKFMAQTQHSLVSLQCASSNMKALLSLQANEELPDLDKLQHMSGTYKRKKATYRNDLLSRKWLPDLIKQREKTTIAEQKRGQMKEEYDRRLAYFAELERYRTLDWKKFIKDCIFMAKSIAEQKKKCAMLAVEIAKMEQELEENSSGDDDLEIIEDIEPPVKKARCQQVTGSPPTTTKAVSPVEHRKFIKVDDENDDELDSSVVVINANDSEGGGISPRDTGDNDDGGRPNWMDCDKTYVNTCDSQGENEAPERTVLQDGDWSQDDSNERLALSQESINHNSPVHISHNTSDIEENLSPVQEPVFAVPKLPKKDKAKPKQVIKGEVNSTFDFGDKFSFNRFSQNSAQSDAASNLVDRVINTSQNSNDPSADFMNLVGSNLCDPEEPLGFNLFASNDGNATEESGGLGFNFGNLMDEKGDDKEVNFFGF